MNEKATDAVQAAREIMESVAPIPQEAAFGEDAEQVDFLPAPWLERLAAGHIRQYAEFAHLRNEQISYLWKREGGKTGGQAVLGKCTKAGGLVKHFSEAGWVIWLAADWARDFQFDRQQIEALLYHEMAHIGYDVDSGKVVAVTHDFQGFVSEIKRFGDWMSGLQVCKDAWEQRSLFAVDAVRQAVDALVPKPGDGIESVTISTKQGSVTLDGETRRKLDRMRNE